MSSVARLHADVEAQRAAARRAIRARRASIDPPDEELILPLPTELEAPSNHLTGRGRKTTLVLVVILATIATIAMGSGGALWKRERILIQFISSEIKCILACVLHTLLLPRASLSNTHITHTQHTHSSHPPSRFSHAHSKHTQHTHSSPPPSRFSQAHSKHTHTQNTHTHTNGRERKSVKNVEDNVTDNRGNVM
jgi:hypothetical protein